MYKKIICHVIILCFLLPSFAWAQTDENETTPQEIPQDIKDCKIDDNDLGTLTVVLREYIVANCNKTTTGETTTDADGNEVVTWETVLFELNKDTNELTVTRTTGSSIKGNLGRSFPNNIALPIKKNKTTIDSIEKIDLTNYSTVLGDEVKELIDSYRDKLKQGYLFNYIEITSTADKFWPTISIPSGHSREQVLNSYDMSEAKFTILHNAMGAGARDHQFAKNQAQADEYNTILAKNRGKNIKILIKKLVFEPLATEFAPSLDGKTLDQWMSVNVKINHKINQEQRQVNITDNLIQSNDSVTQRYAFTPQEEEIVEERTKSCDDQCANETRKSKKNECVRTCCRDACLKEFPNDKKKQRQCKRKCGKSLLSKILIGVGIGAAVGAAAYGISRIGKRNNNESSGTNPNYTPPVDNSINGWKFISATGKCIPLRFDPSKLDNVLYFKEESECLTKVSAPTTTKTNSSPSATVNTPRSNDDDIVESNNDSRDIIEDEPEVDNLSDSQILQQANSGIGEITTVDPGYCTNVKYKILDDCYMTGHNHMRQKDPNVAPHPNYKVRSKKGVVKLFMKKILVCQYVENRAKYTIILDRDCRNGNL